MTQTARIEPGNESAFLRIVGSLIVASMLLGAAPVAPAVSSPASANDSASAADVVKVVRSAFEALQENNQDAWNRATAANFFAFDGGKRLDRAQLFDVVKSAHAAGKIYVWKVTEPEAHVAGSFAWLTYINRGTIGDAGGKTSAAEWLESAVLHHESGHWRLLFLHSTPVSSPH